MSSIQASISNNMSQIIPFPLVSNTTAPADWVGEFSDLVAHISKRRSRVPAAGTLLTE